ncbi:hypothetical protein QKU48_gp1090 [Fadolivirus algeromassiliense]|jgi:IS30 family transposase|uniref:Uncharacterized protein n=1 Tax=Fadolivirus FV1/VV64 TaxID=3070911 RepID=A0A7D3UQM6_9VIRU|nr:hypothetical protein QKU48_gp1090 [Fadolivirus algeromassiliense]QKF94548.1 hypothetical protein Fadolivirus_1_1090 [Fadolivirus FV1/VV64]
MSVDNFSLSDIDNSLKSAQQEKRSITEELSHQLIYKTLSNDAISQLYIKELGLETTIEMLQFEKQEYQREQAVKNKYTDLINILSTDLSNLPLSILTRIIKHKYGVDQIKFYSTFNSMELTLTSKDYRYAIIKKLHEDSCNKCNSLYHTTEKCTDK